MSGECVLVVGGAGYVGSHAARALHLAGFMPVVFDNLSTGNAWAVRWGPFVLGDMHDRQALDEAFAAHEPVAIMQFAASALVGESMADPARYYRNNVCGTLNVLDAARTHGVSLVVFSSTCAIYGVPARVPIAEDAPKQPINPYGASKLMFERMLADYGCAFGMRHVALRYFNAAGADPEARIGEFRRVETHLVPIAIAAVLGHGPPVTVNGVDYPTPDGTAVRDYVHVVDLAEAHVAALHHMLRGGASLQVNLGTGRGCSVREVLAGVGRVANAPVPHQIGPQRPGDPPELVAEPGRSATELGLRYAHSRSIDYIVRTAWRWHRRQHDVAVERGGIVGPGRRGGTPEETARGIWRDGAGTHIHRREHWRETEY